MNPYKNVSDADFAKWNQEREEYLRANAELSRENLELRYKVEQLSARLYLNGLSFHVSPMGG